jgi:hypothetical protein
MKFLRITSETVFSRLRVYIISALFILTVSCSPLRVYRDLPEVKAWEPEIEKLTAVENACL